MRRMRTGARATVLAAIGTAALVAPLVIAASPAEAQLIPKAELSIVKTVGSHGPTITLDPTLSNTGENGHLEWVEDGLRIYTEMDPGSCVSTTPPNAVGCIPQLEQPEMRIAEYLETTTLLSDVVNAPQPYGFPYMDFQAAPPHVGLFQPEYHLLVDIYNDDGVPDLELMRPLNGGNDWSGFLLPGGTTMFNALTTGGMVPAPTNVGTLSAWLTALTNPQLFPNANPTVTAFGFEIPAGALMDGTVRSIDFAGTRYPLGRVYQSGITAAPGETVSYKLAIANGSSVNSKAAQGVQVADVLPPELTYLPGSLQVSTTNLPNSWGAPTSWPCSFTNNMLTCAATTFAKGEKRYVRFWATLSESINTSGLPQTDGHWVDVKHNDNATVLNVGQTRTMTAMCPADYMATDGGLLLDQAGSSADIVIESSGQQANTATGIDGWEVRATNLGAAIAEVTVQVTCLAVEVGASGGHTHVLDAMTLPLQKKIQASDLATNGRMVQRSCPTGYTPYAPEFETGSGVATIRESYVVDGTWYWVVDHSDGTDLWFGLGCLAPQTLSSGGHTADLVVTTPDDTISVASETQTEGIMACPADSNAIVGGYGGYTSQVRSLGAEPRGDKYMFRFYNEDWDSARNADIQVTCVGALTTDEPTYKDVVNTAYVTTTTKDRDYSDNQSSANVAANGDPVAGLPSGVILNALTATRTLNGNDKATALTFDMKCTKTKACNFTVKAFSGANLVASKTTSILALASKNVAVPTTGLGKNLAFGDNLVVKIKTTAGTTTYNVGIVS